MLQLELQIQRQAEQMCYLGASSPLLGRWWANHFRENVRVFSQKIRITTQHSCKYKCLYSSSYEFSPEIQFYFLPQNGPCLYQTGRYFTIQSIKIKMVLLLNIKLSPTSKVCNCKVVDTSKQKTPFRIILVFLFSA